MIINTASSFTALQYKCHKTPSAVGMTKSLKNSATSPPSRSSSRNRDTMEPHLRKDHSVLKYSTITIILDQSHAWEDMPHGMRTLAFWICSAVTVHLYLLTGNFHKFEMILFPGHSLCTWSGYESSLKNIARHTHDKLATIVGKTYQACAASLSNLSTLFLCNYVIS